MATDQGDGGQKKRQGVLPQLLRVADLDRRNRHHHGDDVRRGPVEKPPGQQADGGNGERPAKPRKQPQNGLGISQPEDDEPQERREERRGAVARRVARNELLEGLRGDPILHGLVEPERLAPEVIST
jgi:hypothetical protein